MEMKMLKDNQGKLSSGRVMSFLLFLFANGFWAYKSLHMMQPLTPEDVELIKWGNITAIGGKALQKFGEK